MTDKPQFKSSISLRLSFFDQLVRDKTLGGRAIPVAWRLVQRINDSTGECFPSVDLLSKELNVAEKTVRRAIEQLIDREWFEKKSRGRGGTLYFPNYEKRSHVTILNSKKNRSPLSKKPVTSGSMSTPE